MKTITLFFSLLFACTAFAQNALNFDGLDDYVSTTYSAIGGNGARTVEAWIKTTKNYNPSTSGTQGVILDYGSTATGQRFTFNVLWSNAIRIEVGGNGLSGTAAVNDGNWHHVAVVYNPSLPITYYLYVDGVLDASGNLTVPTNTASSTNVTIGKRIDNINFFEGTIDEVRIWNIPRSASDIANSRNSEFCAIPVGLVAYYKFNQGVAGSANPGLTTLTDVAGTNNGTLNAFALAGSTSNWVAGKTLTTGSTTPGNASITACDSYTAQTGAIWTTSGNYVDTIMSSVGCDSILNVALTINQSSTGSMTTTACNKFVSPSGNNTWTTSGTYMDILTNAVGCDSVITINLTISVVDTQVFQNGIVLSAWATGATYQWLDCANGYAPVAGATSQSFTPTANGTYAVQLNKNGCVDTSACFTVTGVGLAENQANFFALFPNPSQGEFVIRPIQTIEQGTLSIYAMDGKLVYQTGIEGQAELRVSTTFAPGVYVVQLKNSKGVQSTPLIIK